MMTNFGGIILPPKSVHHHISLTDIHWFFSCFSPSFHSRTSDLALEWPRVTSHKLHQGKKCFSMSPVILMGQSLSLAWQGCQRQDKAQSFLPQITEAL